MSQEGTQFAVWAEDDKGVAPSALPIKLLESPPVLEQEPNNQRDQATEIVAPGYAVGVIDRQGDRDHFCFASIKGKRWDLRVRARDLRSPLDPVLRVFNGKGRNLASNDDDRSFSKSSGRFNTPEDGDFVLQVEDRLKRGGEDFVYLLEATAPVSRVEVKLEERRRYEATPIEIPQGGSTAALLTLTRRDVGGAMQLEFLELPPGVTAELFPLAANYNRMPVVFSAASDAALTGALYPMEVHLAEGQRKLVSKFAQQTWFVRGRNNRPI